MKLLLGNESYTTRSLSAAAQTCINLYAERVETQGGSGKSDRILRGTPGFHQLTNLSGSGGNIRGIWSGGGRCFVVAGQWLYEINNGGGIVSSANLGSSDSNPVQMFGNGNQLGIVNNGQFYIDNGFGGPLKCRFQLNGVVTIAGGVNLTWVSGDLFPSYAPSTADFLPTTILVSGQPRTVTFLSTTTATLGSAFGGSTGTCATFLDQVYWVSGDTFTTALEGRPFIINSVTYTVLKVVSPVYLTLTTPTPGQYFGVAFSGVQTNITYSTAGGDLVTAVTGAYLDGTFFAQRPSGGTPDLGRQVTFSAVNDGTSWAGLDFFSKEGYPDYIQSIFADREQLYLFGTESSEVWQNDPNTGRPVRIQGAMAREGSLARYSVVSMQEHLYFIGGSPGGGPVAYRVDGFTPTRISTHAVEERWSSFGNSAAATRSWWYLEDGHYFWVVCFPNDNAWVYDATEKFWHERAGSSLAQSPYLLWYHTYIPEWGSGQITGLHVVGEFNSARIHIMSSTYYDENGANVQRIRDLPYIYNEDKRVYVGRVQLSMDTGETTSLEPSIFLQWSDDNGATISTPEAAGFGATGEYGKRVFWICQGSAETSRIPRISYTGQQQLTLIDCNAEVTFGDT